MVNHKVATQEEWLEARKILLEKEKAHLRANDQLAAERRALPWLKVDKDYTFDAPEGKVTLSDLFGKCSQLFVKHFMLGPDQSGLCVGCSFEVDHVGGILVHLQNHDIEYVAIARAPIEEIEAVRKRMDWNFRWVSSFHSEFNYDFNVSFTPEDRASGKAFYNYKHGDPRMDDLSGNSVFYKDDEGQIYYTYGTFGRGGEEVLGAYRFIDMTPKGRQENGPFHSLPDWVRLHNAYGKSGTVEPNGQYHQPTCGCDAKHQGR